jgi:hypothetical protein
MLCGKKGEPMKSLIKGMCLGSALVAALAVPSGSAFANVAANTQIVNSAKLTYAGGSAAASVVVSVALVPSTPNVSINPGSTAYTAPNTPLIGDSVTITATANGPATYTIVPSIPAGGSVNVTAASPASVSVTSPSVTIGASVTTGTSGTTFVTVPSGIAAGSGSAVNGIGPLSTIIFNVNGNSYTRSVLGTTDNGNGTFTINWSTPILAADVPPAGVLIAEQKTVQINVLPGTVLATGSNITVSVTAQVSTPNATTATVTTASPNIWTTPSPNVSISKYVRNASTGVAGSGGAINFTINTVSSTFYTAGVTGKPGDTLEYVVVASNTGTTDLNAAAISDQIPTAYVNFVTGPGPYGGKDVFYIDSTNATFTFTAASVGANQASYVISNSPNLVVNVGTGASNLATGTVPAGKSVTIASHVIIK